MNYIWKTIKYLIRGFLVLILIFLSVGAISYEGNIFQYIQALDSKDRNTAVRQVSIARPHSILQLFIATPSEQPTVQTESEISTSDSFTDEELESFFGDFADDLASYTGEQETQDYGFATQTASLSWDETTSSTIDTQISDQEKEKIYQLLQNRQQRPESLATGQEQSEQAQ